MADEMDDPIILRRDETGENEPKRVPPAVIAAGVGAAIVGLGLLSWMLYRSRRRRDLMSQIRMEVPRRMRAMPNQMRALPSRVGELRGLSDEVRGRLRRVR